MQLVTRVSAFFLVALLVALAGYSAALFFCVRYFLNSEFDDRLQGALQILAATVEIEEDDVTWNPAEYTIEFEREILRDVRWVVANEDGAIVEHSPLLSPSRPEDALVLDYARRRHAPEVRSADLGSWRIAQKYLATDTPKPAEQRESNEYASLIVTVARSHEDLHKALSRLATLVCVLPTIVWVGAAVAGRLLVRSALRPLAAMAARAMSMTRPDFAVRLPISSAPGEVQELGSALNRLLDRLQEAFERQRRFAGDAAHQLRTPMTVLRGHIEVAQRRMRTPEEYRHTLTVLATQVDELSQIVDSLLFLARHNEIAALPQREVLNLSQWLTDYMVRWKSHSRSADLTLNCTNDAWVVASAPLLQQLIDNLVDNALKYSDAGTPVRVDVRRDAETVEVAVQDQGIGISEADQQVVFEPFFRAPTAPHAGVAGTGLGLAVARRIAQSMGGDLTCHSTIGTGSTFLLRLPAAAVSQGTADASASTKPGSE